MTAPRGTAVSRAQTRQRKAVADALRASLAALSAHDLYVLLRREGRSVSRSTVYRVLRHLAEVQKWAVRVRCEFDFADVEVTAQLRGTCPQCQVRDEAHQRRQIAGAS